MPRLFTRRLTAYSNSIRTSFWFRPGFYTYHQDPLTEMTLEQHHFADFGRWLKQSGLPASVILEGGYSDDLPILVEAFLAEWSDQ